MISPDCNKYKLRFAGVSLGLHKVAINYPAHAIN